MICYLEIIKNGFGTRFWFAYSLVDHLFSHSNILELSIAAMSSYLDSILSALAHILSTLSKEKKKNHPLHMFTIKGELCDRYKKKHNI